MINWSQNSDDDGQQLQTISTKNNNNINSNNNKMTNSHCDDGRLFVEKEFIRMGFDSDSRWRISDINKNFELCNTYPRYLILPASFEDQDLESVAKFRYFKRIPTAVWRHLKNGCFIVRSSQPTVGWFGWFRSDLDECLVKSYVNNTMPFDSISEQLITSVDDSQPPVDQTSVDNNGTIVDHSTNHDETNSITKSSPPISRLPPTPTLTSTLSHHLLSQQTNQIINNLYEAMMKTTITTTTNNSATTATISKTSDSDNQLQLSQETYSSNQNPASDIDLSSTTTTSNCNNTLASDETISSVTESSCSKMLIIDARSYTAAMANRAKGGGCECSEYYLRCEVQFMNLANIHSIRKSFHAIRSVCEAYSEQSNNWVSFLDNSRWLHHISGLIKSALLIVNTIDIEEKSILIHCSDGWDRTPQLVAVAELMLDPYYRTFEGFKTLVQREWLDFGHKFADRCGSNTCHEDPNERCPVFLQWLDCVQQLLVQYPKHFEFNSLYLDKFNRHTYSNVFGTFSYNSTQERILSKVDEKMLSLWSYFDSSRRKFRNDKYVQSDEILRPSYKVRDLHFWKEVYMPPINKNQTPFMPSSIASNIDNKKFHDSLYIDGLKRTICK